MVVSRCPRIRGRSGAVLVLACSVALTTGLTTAWAAPAVTRTTLVSATPTAGEENGLADRPHLSGNGRFVAFDSTATNLDPKDRGSARDIYVRDLQSNAVELVSVALDNGAGNGYSTLSSISDDGRYVAFQSVATNLVAGDTNRSGDIFVRDRLQKKTVLASVSRTGGFPNGQSTRPTISGDGHLVAYNSGANNLLPGSDGNAFQDIFVRDLVHNTTERVSVGRGAPPNGDSVRPEMRGSGRFVAFESQASNLVPGDTNGNRDIFLYDRQSGKTTRANVTPSGGNSRGEASRPHLTPDGRFVAFESASSDLVAGDTNNDQDVFVRDMVAGRTELVSKATSGVQGAAESTRGVLSFTGRYVAFNSTSANLVAKDTNSRQDVFLRDRQTGTTTRISLTATGGQSNGTSFRPVISGDGATVVYESLATNLTANDPRAGSDIFATPAG